MHHNSNEQRPDMNIKQIFAKSLRTLLCCVSAIFLAGCFSSAKENARMDSAESLMESAPDSAMTILDSISLGALSSQKDKARYALLKSMALDKNYIDATSFDLLQPAIDYYLKKGSPDEKLRTLYYQGRIYQNRGNDDEEAMRCFLKATEESDQILDSLCLGRTYFAMSVLYASQYRMEDYILSAHNASEIFSRINRNDLRRASLNNELDGYILLDNKQKADSIMSLLASSNNSGDDPYNSYLHNKIIYGVEFLSDNSLRLLLDSLSMMPSGEDIQLDMARAYAKIGQPEKAQIYLDSVKADEYLQSPKYWAIKSEIFERNNDLSDALGALKSYILVSDSNTNSLISQDLLFVEQRYALEKAALVEKQEKDSIKKNSIISVLCLIILGMFLSLRLRLVEIKKLKLENSERKLKESLQYVSNENKKIKTEHKQILTEHEQILNDSKRMKENFEALLEERDSLVKLINSKDNVSEEFIQLVKGRLDILNSFIAYQISTSEKQLKQSNSMLEKATKNKEDFINSTKLIYESLYPEFMASLQEKGLSELEVRFVCLYALGLRGKDIGEYLQTKRFYNISSDIREKFGLGENDTNLGLYIRSRLR